MKVANAILKVGDKVTPKSGHNPDYGKHGVILEINHRWCAIQFEDGGKGKHHEDSLKPVKKGKRR
ncbi:MAG: hypothetical protein ACREDR_06820 [Blastocatellia bacterium]